MMSGSSRYLLYFSFVLCLVNSVHSLVCIRCVSFAENGKCQQGGNIRTTQSCYGPDVTCYARSLDWGKTRLFKRGCFKGDICNGVNETDVYCSSCRFGRCNSRPIDFSPKKEVKNNLSPVLSNLLSDHSSNNIIKQVCTCTQIVIGTDGNEIYTGIQPGEYEKRKIENKTETLAYSVTETSKNEVNTGMEPEVHRTEENRNKGDGENSESVTTTEYFEENITGYWQVLDKINTNEISTEISQKNYEVSQNETVEKKKVIDNATENYDENVTEIVTEASSNKVSAIIEQEGNQNENQVSLFNDQNGESHVTTVSYSETATEYLVDVGETRRSNFSGFGIDGENNEMNENYNTEAEIKYE